MKKKILLSVLAIFAFAMFMVTANAQDSALGISFKTAAKTPSSVPTAGKTMYGTVTDTFKFGEGNDFSKIIFTTATGEEAGESNLRKIIIGDRNLGGIAGAISPELTTDEEKLAAAFSNWFTAYCLDGTLKYPDIAIYSSKNFYDSYVAYARAKATAEAACPQDPTGDTCTQAQTNANTAAVGLLNSIVRAAIFNDASAQDKLATAAGYTTSMVTNYASGDYELVGKDVATALTDFLDSSKGMPDRSFNVSVHKVTFTKYGTPIETKDVTFNNYNLTVNPLNVVFDSYTVNDKTNSVDTNSNEYTKALWIIEHTYPSVSLQTALSDAGASLDTLKTEMATLYGLTDPADINAAVENSVYGVIQYAIWSVTGTSPDGTIYTGVKESVSAELNKLFQYLVDPERVIPSDYATGMSFTNTITINEPGAGLELVSKTDSTYTYGPYSATYNALDGGSISISVTTEGASGVKVVDGDGNEVTEVEPGQEFFVQVPLKAKLGNVSLRADATIIKFTPDGLRGRIYQPTFVLGQNVMSGGSTTTEGINASFDVIVNAKTGVEDIAVLLMVTLVAFSLGYLVLSFKGKAVELG